MGSQKNNRNNDSILTTLQIVKTVIEILAFAVNIIANLSDTASK